MKKVLSLVLVLALVLGSFSFAFAFEDTAELDCEEAVDTLVGLGVINGYNDGTFRPENTVTRAQIAKMLVVALGYEDLISGTTSSFTDCTGHWADSYIAFAAGQGITNGFPDGTFKPDDAVSYDQAITMIVRALGYTDDALAGSWPTNYKIKALDLKITKDVKITKGGADRGGVATLIYNALEAELVTVNADNEVIKETPKKVLLDRIGKKVPGHFVSYDDVYDEDNALETAMDLKPYLFQNVDYYENTDEEVAYVSKVNSETLEGEVETAAGIYVEDADDDIYNGKITANTKYFFNGELAADSSLFDGADVKVYYTDTDEDGKLDTNEDVIGVVGTKVTSTKKIDKEYKDGKFVIDGIKLPKTTDDDDDDVVDFDKLVVEGDATSLEEIKEDDVVSVYTSELDGTDPKAVKLVVARNTVDGKVTKIIDKDDIEIDGVGYKTVADNDITASKLGNEYTFFLDKDGEIFAYDEISVELTNYAVVIDTEDGAIDTAFGSDSVDTPAQIKLAKADGETVVYDLYYDIDDSEGCTLDDAELLTEAGVVLDVNAVLANKLVKYDTNSEGEINELELVTLDVVSQKYELSGSKLGSAYTIGDNTILFDKTDDYAVVDLDDLDDSVTVSAVEDDDSSFGALEVCIVEAGVNTSSDGNYAVVINKDNVLNSDDKKVLELTVLIDGVEKTYLTDDDTVANTDATTDTLVDLDINSDDEVKGSEVVATDAAKKIEVVGTVGTSTVQAIDADAKLIRINGTNYDIADDAVVYVCNYDTDEWDDTVVGDLDDIDEEDFVKAYDLDTAEEDGVEVIFIYTGDTDKVTSW